MNRLRNAKLTKSSVLKISIGVLIVLTAIFWWTQRVGSDSHWKMVALWCGWLGFFTFGLTLFLSIRSRWMDRLAGGLDKSYRIHRFLGSLACILLILHVAILSGRFLGVHPGKAFWFPFPAHHRLAVNLGSIGFWLLILLIIMTAIPKIPYDKWLWTHRFMGVPWLLAILHVGFSLSFVSFSALFGIYLIWAILGVFAWLWGVAIKSHIGWTRSTVVAIERPTTRHLQIRCQTEHALPSIIPGQYAFFRFPLLGREEHPLTVIPVGSNEFALSVKVVGDYTQTLYQKIATGIPAYMSRPYGTFDYHRGGNRQIWIGGGVGISPFLAWLHALSSAASHPERVDLFYCVRHEADASHDQELQRWGEILGWLTYNAWFSVKNGHLKAANVVQELGEIEGCDIFICGPPRMIRELTRDFPKFNVRRQQIHSEVFSFRNSRAKRLPAGADL